MSVEQLTDTFIRVIVNPILALVFGAALLVFIWGIIEYLYALNVKGETSEEGRKHMLWGIIGMFIMAVSYTIITIIANTICTGGLAGCYR